MPKMVTVGTEVQHILQMEMFILGTVRMHIITLTENIILPALITKIRLSVF